MTPYNLFIVFMLCFVSTISAQNQDAQRFSLDEAIAFALKNNRTAKNAARDIDVAKQQKWETTATGLPQINAAVDYQNWLKQQVQLIPADAFGGNPNEFVEATFGTKQNVNASATLSQLLFDGSYLVGLQSAKVYLEISENAKLKTDLEVRKAVINAYGNVLLAKESIAILNSNIAVIEKNVHEAQKIYENGLGEEETVEQLTITLSELNSYLNRTKRLKSVAYQLLNITLGQDLNTLIELTDSLENLTTQNLSLNILTTNHDIKNTIDYKIAENDKRSKELLVKLAKSKSLPSLSAFINAGYAGYSNTFTFLNNNQNWFGSALLGVSLNVPIFSSFQRKAEKARATINLEQAETNLTETEQQLKLQLASAKNEFQFAIEDYQNKTQNLALAKRIENKNQIKFFEGVATSFELRQAQTQLYTAQEAYLQAMLNVITAKAELETVLNITN